MKFKVNHWWGVKLGGWYVYWNRRLIVTRRYPHTEN
jgi:hypothetical protein